MEINTKTLERLGWVEKNNVWTYTEVVNGNKFRIGWHSITHKCYIGYGELPIPVETDWHLLAIMRVCGLEEQVFRYLAVVE